MISVAAYLENEKVADLNSEYAHGRCFPVTGASPLHDRLCMRLVRRLNAHLDGSPCRVFRPRVKTHIRLPGDERFYYPDIQVACGEPRGLPDYLDCPRLIVEAMREGTERRIREEKAPAYRTLDSLQELALIACDRPCILLWQRLPAGWTSRETTGEERLRLTSIGLDLSVAELYAGLPLGA